MSILAFLSDCEAQSLPLVITPLQYQDLCLEVLALAFEDRPQYDNLILNYNYNGKEVTVKEPEETL
jgi:hypothetical protein